MSLEPSLPPDASQTSAKEVSFGVVDAEGRYKTGLDDSKHDRRSFTVRPSSEKVPQSLFERRKHELINLFGNADPNQSLHGLGRQYRLEASRPSKNHNTCLKVLGLRDAKVSIYESSPGVEDEASLLCCGLNPNKIVIKFLHWVLRHGILTFLTLACVIFLALSFFFALILFGLGSKYPYCVGGVNFAEDGDKFTDAFILSWTTLSTVGYGVIYYGISPFVPDVRDCTGMTIVITLEAFVGILFASMCGAILFIKIGRIQSIAQVIFSDAILIRYGSGVQIPVNDEEDQQNPGGSKESVDGVNLPCPILEFRIANKMNHVMGGEIVDCSINIIASVDPVQASGLAKTASRRRRRGKKGKRAPPKSTQVGNRKEKEDTEDEKESDHEATTEFVLQKLGLKNGAEKKDNDKDQSLLNNFGFHRSFVKIEPELFDHPYFKRVWIIRHVLNEDSPLLNNYARQLLKNNKGFWPTELNSPHGVRAAVDFDSLLVSFSGTSNADANTVYAQHIYDFGDVSVGYSFCNMLYRDNVDDSLYVDLSLINNVMEQNGGGGEPLEHAVPKSGMNQKVVSLTV